MSEQDFGKSQISRRHAIAAAAAAGVTAWVAPQIHSVAVAQTICASPRTCTPVSVSWIASPFAVAAANANGSDLCSGSYGVLGANATTITASRTPSVVLATPVGNDVSVHTITNTAGGATETTGVVKNATQGNLFPFVPICSREQNTNPSGVTNQTVSLTINFSNPVTKLSFTIVDIDASGGLTTDSVSGGVGFATSCNIAGIGTAYKEQIALSWVAASGTPNVTYSPGALLTNPAANTYTVNTAAANLGGSNFAGAPGPANIDPYNQVAGATVCNLGVSFDGCGTISSFTITSSDLLARVGSSTAAQGAGRASGISNLSWCV